MIKLFSYGTLCQKEVQLREFGQEFFVENEIQSINGYKITKAFIDDGYYNVAMPSPGDSISGYIVHIPENLIELVDEYESDSYIRTPVKTTNGLDCIMYKINNQ